MAQSNAERQRRYINRLKARAGQPLVEEQKIELARRIERITSLILSISEDKDRNYNVAKLVSVYLQDLQNVLNEHGIPVKRRRHRY